MTITNDKLVEVVTVGRKRRWSLPEKKAIIEETYQSGMTVSYVARKHGIYPSQLFYWRKRYEDGALTGIKSSSGVAPKAKVDELEKRIKQLECVLGRKTVENEILREAVKIGREKKLISQQPLPGIDDLG